MTWIYWLLVALAATALLLAGAYITARWLQGREPYQSVMKLRTRQKLRFLAAIARDRRVPKLVRALPFLLGVYLAIPFDIVPDFIPVLGYIDDVAIIVLVLALMVRLTPAHLIEEHVAALSGETEDATES